MLDRPRKIVVVTGSRAEYGLLARLIRLLRLDTRVDLRLIVTGSHLVPELGMTVSEIEDAGVLIAERVEIMLASDSGLGMAKSLALATMGLAEAFDRQQPDLIVLLGDRFETLGAASAALMLRLPVAHIAGGQLTEGAIDDSIRHAITKMAHLHFTALESYRRRIMQMGEMPERIFTVGATGLDAIVHETHVPRADIEAHLQMGLGECSLLVTFHPETLSPLAPQEQVSELLAALAKLDESVKLIFTGVNADVGGRAVCKAIEQFVKKRPKSAVLVQSLGHRRYLSCLRHVAGVIGNSSSGLIEAPSFKVGTINIGDRQKGRPRAASIIDCPLSVVAIDGALRRLFSPEFRAELDKTVNAFGDGYASDRIAEILATYPLPGLLNKYFVDNFSNDLAIS